MKADEVNEGDCFILDMGETIYYWIGLESNYYERLKALEIAVGIRRDERKDKAVLHYPRDMGGQIEEDFWNHLGGRPSSIKAAVPDTPAADEETMNRYRFWHVSDASGAMVHTEIEERPLNAKMLTEDDSYILELYDTIYVWQGKHASASEKHNGMAFAKKMVKDNNKPRACHITRMP